MQIVIPMSGFGERFRQAGYDVPKPLIEIEASRSSRTSPACFQARTVSFSSATRTILTTRPTAWRRRSSVIVGGKVVEIDPHKLGPVHAVRTGGGRDRSKWADHRQLLRLHVLLEPGSASRTFVKQCRCDGAITPAYKAFTRIRWAARTTPICAKSWLLDIREKQPFTENRMEVRFKRHVLLYHGTVDAGSHARADGTKKLRGRRILRQHDVQAVAGGRAQNRGV